jgi:hypothetical protein
MGALKALRVAPTSAKRDRWQAIAVIENRGLAFFRPQGEMELVSPDGAVIERAEFVPMPTLPRREQNYVFALQTTTPGQYRLRAKVEVAGEVQEGTAEVVIEDPVHETEGAMVAAGAAAAALPADRR